MWKVEMTRRGCLGECEILCRHAHWSPGWRCDLVTTWVGLPEAPSRRRALLAAASKMFGLLPQLRNRRVSFSHTKLRDGRGTYSSGSAVRHEVCASSGRRELMASHPRAAD